MSDNYSHFEWIADVASQLENMDKSTLSPEWDSVESYTASIVINSMMRFESMSRTEKNDVFAYLLGCLVRFNKKGKSNNE